MVKDYQRRCVKCGAVSVFIELDEGWCPPCYKNKFITEKTNEQNRYKFKETTRPSS